MKLSLLLFFIFNSICTFSQSNDSSFVNYHWTNPTKTYHLPKKLKEISGIAFIDENLIACIEDEHGILYLFDFKKGKIKKEIEFAEDGDYEDLAIEDKNIFILRNDGELFKIKDFQSKNPEFSHFPSNVPAQDNEGICYDSSSKNILIACKGKFGKGLVNQFRREIHLFNLDDLKTSETPLFTIKIDSVIDYANKNKIPLPIKIKNDSTIQVLKLRMSSLAIHPVSNDIYILSSFDHSIFIFNQKGDLKHMEILDEKLFPQAEGITFMKNGNLLISNEGKGILPTIIELKPKEN